MQTVDNAQDELAAQLRFESFKLGKPLPASMKQHRHSRSHSRNASISSVASLPLTTSKSTNLHDFSSLPTTNSMPALASKRNSHHRRLSSVSTRHESAEIMGVDLPVSAEQTASEKDSIRRRALWALEGKQDDASYSKVEIPELSTPEMENLMFDFSSKSFTAPSNTGYNSALMSNKRDSFKPSSSKDQLHTLVEEEEEEEDSQEHLPRTDMELPATSTIPDSDFAKSAPSRPRPATLTLRPLSLIQNAVSTVAHGLPTPSTPEARSGLRSLALVPIDETCSAVKRNPSVLSDASSASSSRVRPMLNLQISAQEELARPAPSRRSSISYKSSSSTAATGLPTPEMTPTFAERRYSHSSNGSASTLNSDDEFPPAPYSHLEKALSVRRTSMASFPASRPISSSGSEYTTSSEPSDEMLRLVADLKAERDELKRDVDGWRVRVGDLEKQIELLGKRVESERREAWVARSRVNLLEAEKSSFDKELEQIKNEMRTMVDVKDAEIDRLKALIRHHEKDKERTAEENTRLLRECGQWRTEVERLSKDVAATHDAHSNWRRGLQYASADFSESTTDVDLCSFDSDNEFGFPLKAVEEEQEEDLDLHCSQIPEEDVEDDYISEEDNGLAGYEDEDEDMTFQSSVSSSSFGSVHETHEPHSVAHLQTEAKVDVTHVAPSQTRPLSSSGSGSNTPGSLTPGSRSPSPSPVALNDMGEFNFPRTQAPAAPTHQTIGSLSKTWTFSAAQSSARNGFHWVPIPVSPSFYTYEHSKGLFARGLEAFDEDEAMPFSLPFDVVGTIVEESPGFLPVVVEEEEDEEDDETKVDNEDEDMFGDIAGIKITFTPAADDDDDNEYPSPQLEDSEHEDDYDDDDEEIEAEEEIKDSSEQDRSVDIQTDEEVLFQQPFTDTSVQKPTLIFEEFNDGSESGAPFNFGRPLRSSTPPNFSIVTPASVRVPLPSSIPRPTSSFTSSLASVDSSPTMSPSKIPVRSTSSFITPPAKRGGAIASFIPQPVPSVTSPSPIRKGPSLREKPPVASFIQPPRKPLMSAIKSKTGQNDSNGSAIQSSNCYNFNFYGAVVMNDAPSNRSIAGFSTDPFASNSSFQTNQSYSHSNKEGAGYALNSSFSWTSSMPPSADSTSFSSPLSSIMNSPKISFQTFAGFIPRAWGARSEPTSDSADCAQAAPAAVAKFTTYVSRDKQLERLRLRFQHESLFTQFYSHDMCQKCDGAIVSL
ncbi:hypothetical protein BDP27DRAFT_1414485 [Rhodocollybia butyracea]|uniref:Uncharacterized protein n=1 Tax=Rhodocollybia butyracea TaxID=206335 RepID=A0A9P5Q9B4_9AGAR|nr:hypothetical protein BDP27DRAFT_1414485 [Rhodocollybia butyracea]